MSGIDLFEKNGLGLARDNKVRLVEHNPIWTKVFESESLRIREALRIDSLKLHHCGSTSIPGIFAKPIIDIVGEVSLLKDLDEKKDNLISLGYAYKGEYGIEGRRYCVLYNEEETIGYCHLHIFESKHPELLDHILFRDYLTQNAHAAKRYENLKRSLNLPRSEYTKEKSSLIRELLTEAKAQL